MPRQGCRDRHRRRRRVVRAVVRRRRPVDRPGRDATGGTARGCSALGRGVFGAEGGDGEAVVTPVVHTSRGGRTAASTFTVGTRIDGLAVMMLFVVTLISLLVHIYSTAYMHDDVRYTHYYAMLSLFTASMLTLVVADNTLQLLVGWERRRPLLVHAHRPLVGGEGATPTPRSRRSSPPAPATSA